MSDNNQVVPVGAVDLGLDPVTDTVGVRQGAFGASGSGDTSGFGGLVASRSRCPGRARSPTAATSTP